MMIISVHAARCRCIPLLLVNQEALRLKSTPREEGGSMECGCDSRCRGGDSGAGSSSSSSSSSSSTHHLVHRRGYRRNRPGRLVH